MLEYKKIKVENIEVHELANITPVMTDIAFESLKTSIKANGQQVPIVMWKGKCVDGRHRIKALRSLGIEEVSYIEEDENKTEEDIRVLVLDVLENRRHQTTTQKAILGYREYTKAKKEGVKLSMGAAASKVSSTRLQVSRVRDLFELSGTKFIDILFDGGSINIGTTAQPKNTDNLLSIITFLKARITDIAESSTPSAASEDFTDAELDTINLTIENLEHTFSNRLLKKLSSVLYYKLNSKSDTERSIEHTKTNAKVVDLV
jgi:hypothetical protein